jgi:UDP-N-acetylmuramoyl-L-alanyl-D-glutamate--2,6-diaminopimelate ligase
MKLLANILNQVEVLQLKGNANVAVRNLCIDSRKVEANSVFIAVRGHSTDGHQFISKAIELGATTIICEEIPSIENKAITFVQVKDCSKIIGLLADNFYEQPTKHLKVVGVTGTNGKTTVATLLYQLFTTLGFKCGLISTVQNHIGDEVINATHTTPDAINIQSLFARMRDAGCSHVFMEVSSHALHQHRIAGVDYNGGIFTNITHDHLDYHKTFDEYIRVKKMFFDNLPSTAFALTNADDRRGMVMLQNTAALRTTYSLKVPATYKGKVLENNLTGLVMSIDSQETHFRMIGTFNAYNLLAVYGAAMQLGEDKMEVLSALSNLIGAKGRFETCLSTKEKILGIIDYAHTPDALINVLATINQLRVGGQQLITVVGCGGDRDATKRPVMAEVACEHSNRAIFTSDNPRSEDPEMILNEMESGLTLTQKRKSLRISDRKEAIKTACTLAQQDDIILIAGKGHENYQEIKGVKYPFDDKEILKETFNLLNK